ERALLQADKFGARLVVPMRAVELVEEDGYHVLHLEDGGRIAGRTVIVASGVDYRRLDVPQLADFEGIGVAYTAAAAEEALGDGDAAVVVGGASSAGQAALSLADHGYRVYLVVRAGTLGKQMARYLIDRIEREPSVEVLVNTELRGVGGAGSLESITVED